DLATRKLPFAGMAATRQALADEDAAATDDDAGGHHHRAARSVRRGHGVTWPAGRNRLRAACASALSGFACTASINNRIAASLFPGATRAIARLYSVTEWCGRRRSAAV